MHPFSTENSGKKYINEVVWETNFGKINLKKINFCLRHEETNSSHWGESASNHTFKMLLKVLSQISHSRISLNLSDQQKLPYKKWYNGNW